MSREHSPLAACGFRVASGEWRVASGERRAASSEQVSLSLQRSRRAAGHSPRFQLARQGFDEILERDQAEGALRTARDFGLPAHLDQEAEKALERIESG